MNSQASTRGLAFPTAMHYYTRISTRRSCSQSTLQLCNMATTSTCYIATHTGRLRGTWPETLCMLTVPARTQLTVPARVHWYCRTEYELGYLLSTTPAPTEATVHPGTRLHLLRTISGACMSPSPICQARN
eukprot:2581056-Rhodomonas_salina.3